MAEPTTGKVGMDAAALRAHCLALPGATAEHPFGPGALVTKVGGRIFAIIGEDVAPPTIGLPRARRAALER